MDSLTELSHTVQDKIIELNANGIPLSSKSSTSQILKRKWSSRPIG